LSKWLHFGDELENLFFKKKSTKNKVVHTASIGFGETPMEAV